jgi:hypothetical protein
MQSNSNTVNNTPLVLWTAGRSMFHSAVTGAAEREKNWVKLKMIFIMLWKQT